MHLQEGGSMRVIKFRGKDKHTSKWVFGDLAHSKGISTNGLYDRVMVGGYHVIEETVGQFTGLLDKSGKEIYEGDILNNGQRNYIVCWNSERGAWWLKSKELIYTQPLGFLSTELFIVGNIHDNLELLKGGEK